MDLSDPRPGCISYISFTITTPEASIFSADVRGRRVQISPLTNIELNPRKLIYKGGVVMACGEALCVRTDKARSSVV
jgi:hypothetical protein